MNLHQAKIKAAFKGVLKGCTNLTRCRKIPYNTKRQAVDNLKSKSMLSRRERAVYKCPLCKKWHMTSQKREK